MSHEDSSAWVEALLLNLNGVPVRAVPALGQSRYYRDPQGAWRPVDGDRLDDIEAVCIRLHDGLASALFGGLQNYYALLPLIPPLVQEAGLNSESTVSRDDFERMIGAMDGVPHLNRLLYLYDCRKLVSGVQECTKEVCFLVGEFYRILNLEPLFYPPIYEPDGIRYLTSPIVTNLTATLNVIYMRLHSLLDYVTKLVFEIENLREDFARYPKLSSSALLFGQHHRTGWRGRPGTLFEVGEPMAEIELVRNHVTHDGLLDEMPKAYKVVEGGEAVEKFVLMPDRTGARFDRLKNRTLFYSRDDRINLRLPRLLADFQVRQVATLEHALDRLAVVAARRPPFRIAD